MPFGERLKILLEESNMDQKEFGKMFNLSPSTVSGYITNYRTPADEIKIQVANYFNVSLDWLLERTHVRNSYENVCCKNENELKLCEKIEQYTLSEEALEEIDDYIDYIKYKYTTLKGKKK